MSVSFTLSRDTTPMAVNLTSQYFDMLSSAPNPQPSKGRFLKPSHEAAQTDERGNKYLLGEGHCARVGPQDKPFDRLRRLGHRKHDASDKDGDPECLASKPSGIQVGMRVSPVIDATTALRAPLDQTSQAARQVMTIRPV